MRRAIDFTSNHTICLFQGESGRYWSSIHDSETDKPVWSMNGTTSDRSEAFDLACNRMDALAEAYISEGEPEDDGSGIDQQEHAKRNGVRAWGDK